MRRNCETNQTITVVIVIVCLCKCMRVSNCVFVCEYINKMHGTHKSSFKRGFKYSNFIRTQRQNAKISIPPICIRLYTPLIRHENACFITLNLQIGYHCFLTKNCTSITLFMDKWNGFVIYLNFWPKLNDLECHLSISFFGILDI